MNVTLLHVIFAFLAAFGLFSLLWAVMGFFLPCCREGWLVTGSPSFVSIYLWLRGFGLVTCPLVVLDQDLSEAQQHFLQQKDIEFCSQATLIRRLGKDIT